MRNAMSRNVARESTRARKRKGCGKKIAIVFAIRIEVGTLF